MVDIWAPGSKVTVCDKSGAGYISTGLSIPADYVAGILAIFYGLEGTAMTPTIARNRLMAQTDPWMTFPAGTNWRNSPAAFANTGNRKGAELNPPLAYRGGPE